MTTQKKAILYARVASIDTSQKPDRLKFQIDSLMVYCQDLNITIVATYSEVANGNNFERKEFQKLLSDLKTGQLKADLLLFTKWDRFTRDILFSGKKMVKELEALSLKPQAVNDKIGSEAILKIVKRLK
jgi:site-specific DNA recombinase